MMAAILHGFSNYVNFSGRTPRSLFWWWVLFVFVLLFVLGIIDSAIMGSMTSDPTGRPLSLIASLALLLPNLGMGVRRLHDTGRSGWWILIGLVPFVGVLVLIYFYIQPSEEAAAG